MREHRTGMYRPPWGVGWIRNYFLDDLDGLDQLPRTGFGVGAGFGFEAIEECAGTGLLRPFPDPSFDPDGRPLFFGVDDLVSVGAVSGGATSLSGLGGSTSCAPVGHWSGIRSASPVTCRKSCSWPVASTLRSVAIALSLSACDVIIASKPEIPFATNDKSSRTDARALTNASAIVSFRSFDALCNVAFIASCTATLICSGNWATCWATCACNP